MRKTICFLLILLTIGIGTGYWLNKSDHNTTSTILLHQENDFLLHVKIEEASEGIRVLHSIQYVGEDEIEMLHKEPLTSVKLDKAHHHFEGEHLKKKMNTGAIYPQGEIFVPIKNKGTHQLYLHTQFTQDGEEVNIEHVEELVFQ